jgi:hypothetical protein
LNLGVVMKKLNRRQFAKLAGSAALAVPIVSALPLGAREAALTERGTGSSQQDASKPGPKLKLTPEQETAVKQAVERRDRQLAAMRSRVLPYSAEPAFVFSVRRRPRGPQKP